MTVRRPDTRLPVDVHGDLCLATPAGGELRLTANGARLHLAVPDWADLARLAPGSLTGQWRALVAAIRVLRKMSLTLDIRVAGKPALALGEGVTTPVLARLLGLTSVDLRLGTLMRLLKARFAAQ